MQPLLSSDDLRELVEPRGRTILSRVRIGCQ